METRLGIIFPGSGSQYHGMMRKAYREHEKVRNIFTQADEILGFSLSDIICSGSTLKLSRIVNMMPAIFVSSFAYYELFQEDFGIIPTIMAGHSLGEYAALAQSGAVSFKDALELVVLRSGLAQEAADRFDGRMTIVKDIELFQVEKILRHMRQEGKELSIGCYNSSRQVAIVGRDSYLEEAEKRIKKAQPGSECVNMPESAPYHSPMMADQALVFEKKLKSVQIRMTSVPVIANYCAKPYNSVEMIREGLVRQLYSPVRWEETIRYFIEHGVNLFVEIGPKNVLKTIHDEAGCPVRTLAYDELPGRAEMKQIFSDSTKIEAEGQEYMEILQSAIAACYTLKNYRNDKADESEVRKQICQLLERSEIVREGDGFCHAEDAKRAILVLGELFHLRLTPEAETQQVMNKILDTAKKQEFYRYCME